MNQWCFNVFIRLRIENVKMKRDDKKNSILKFPWKSTFLQWAQVNRATRNTFFMDMNECLHIQRFWHYRSVSLHSVQFVCFFSLFYFRIRLNKIEYVHILMCSCEKPLVSPSTLQTNRTVNRIHCQKPHTFSINKQIIFFCWKIYANLVIHEWWKKR